MNVNLLKILNCHIISRYFYVVMYYRTRFKTGPRHVGFVVDKVVLGQVFSEYFGFPCQSSFHQYFHNHHHLSSGAGTIGQYWPQYPKSHRTNKKNNIVQYNI
jgi:hypothetical protein